MHFCSGVDTEQARVVALLVERVDITGESASIRLQTEGLASLVRELRGNSPHVLRAA